MPTTAFAFERVTPESQGVDSRAISQFVEAVESQIHELHSFMLLRHGKVIAEGWWSPYGREYPHMLFSLSKSFTSTAIGLAVAEGRLSVKDKVVSFFPDAVPAKISKNLAAMEVRHLLSMSTGHDVEPPLVPHKDSVWTKGFFEVPIVHKPGTHFLYNTAATYMLSAIIQKLTGKRLLEYLKPRLFKPLGIEGATWQVSPEGINTGGFGLSVKTEDIARFGQMYLQNGVWQGKQIVPAAWVKEASTSHIANGDNPESDWNQGYGYQFWRCRHNAYRGDGAFGQYCVVMPEQDAVLAITSGLGDMQQPLNLVWEHLLPAFSKDTRPAAKAEQTRLSKTLGKLNYAPVKGKASAAVVAQISGRTFTLESNPVHFGAATLTFSESGCTMAIKEGRRTETIACGYGTWTRGTTKLFNPPRATQASSIVASGAWTSKDTFTAVVRFYETPFTQTFTFKFSGDTLTLETVGNVAFEPPKPIVINGKV